MGKLSNILEVLAQDEKFQALPPNARRKQIEEITKKAFPGARSQDLETTSAAMVEKFAPKVAGEGLAEGSKKIKAGLVGAAEAVGEIPDVVANLGASAIESGARAFGQDIDLPTSNVRGAVGDIAEKAVGISGEEVAARPYARGAGEAVGTIGSFFAGGAAGAAAKGIKGVQALSKIKGAGKAGKVIKEVGKFVTPLGNEAKAAKIIAQSGTLGGGIAISRVRQEDGDLTAKGVLTGIGAGAVGGAIGAGIGRGIQSIAAKNAAKGTVKGKAPKKTFADRVETAAEDRAINAPKNAARAEQGNIPVKEKAPLKNDLTDDALKGFDAEGNAIEQVVEAPPVSNKPIEPTVNPGRDRLGALYANDLTKYDTAIKAAPTKAKRVSLEKKKAEVLRRIEQGDQAGAPTPKGLANTGERSEWKIATEKAQGFFEGLPVNARGRDGIIRHANALTPNGKAGVKVEYPDGTTAVVARTKVKRITTAEESMLAWNDQRIKHRVLKDLGDELMDNDPVNKQLAKGTTSKAKPKSIKELKAKTNENSKVYSDKKRTKVTKQLKSTKKKSKVGKFLSEEEGSISAEDAFRVPINIVRGADLLLSRPFKVIGRFNAKAENMLKLRAAKSEAIDGKVIFDYNKGVSEINQAAPRRVETNPTTGFDEVVEPGAIGRANQGASELLDSIELDDLANFDFAARIPGKTNDERALAHYTAKAIKEAYETTGQSTKGLFASNIFEDNPMTSKLFKGVEGGSKFQNAQDVYVATRAALEGYKSKIFDQMFDEGGAMFALKERALEYGRKDIAQAIDNVHLQTTYLQNGDKTWKFVSQVKKNFAEATLLGNASAALRNLTQVPVFGMNRLGAGNMAKGTTVLPKFWGGEAAEDLQGFLRLFNLDSSKYAKVGVYQRETQSMVEDMVESGASSSEILDAFNIEANKITLELFGGSEKSINQTLAIVSDVIRQFDGNVDEAINFMRKAGSGAITDATERSTLNKIVASAADANNEINFAAQPGNLAPIESPNNPFFNVLGLMTHAIRDLTFVNEKTLQMLSMNPEIRNQAFMDIAYYTMMKTIIGGTELGSDVIKNTFLRLPAAVAEKANPEAAFAIKEFGKEVDENDKAFFVNSWEKTLGLDAKSGFGITPVKEFIAGDAMPILSALGRVTRKTEKVFANEGDFDDLADAGLNLAGLAIGAVNPKIGRFVIPVGFSAINKVRKGVTALTLNKDERTGKAFRKVGGRSTPTNITTEIRRFLGVIPEDAAIFEKGEHTDFIKKALVDGLVDEYYDNDNFKSLVDRASDEIIVANYGKWLYDKKNFNSESHRKAQIESLRAEVRLKVYAAAVKQELSDAADDFVDGKLPRKEAVTKIKRIGDLGNKPAQKGFIPGAAAVSRETANERFNERVGNRREKRERAGFVQ